MEMIELPSIHSVFLRVLDLIHSDLVHMIYLTHSKDHLSLHSLQVWFLFENLQIHLFHLFRAQIQIIFHLLVFMIYTNTYASLFFLVNIINMCLQWGAVVAVLLAVLSAMLLVQVRFGVFLRC